jgi:uncharacterized membrane protein YidH (DUF202 family)
MTNFVNWFRTPAHDVGLALIAAGVALIAFTLQLWA